MTPLIGGAASKIVESIRSKTEMWSPVTAEREEWDLLIKGHEVSLLSLV